MGYHIQKPAVKQVRPVGIVARNPGCQFPNPVTPVPTDVQPEKEIFNRIKNRDTVGVQIPDDVSVP